MQFAANPQVAMAFGIRAADIVGKTTNAIFPKRALESAETTLERHGDWKQTKLKCFRGPSTQCQRREYFSIHLSFPHSGMILRLNFTTLLILVEFERGSFACGVSMVVQYRRGRCWKTCVGASSGYLVLVTCT